MIKAYFRVSLLSLFLIVFISCEADKVQEMSVISQTIIPGVDEVQIEPDGFIEAKPFQQFTAQILIDRDYSIYDIQNINIDNDDEDEQIILASPINGDRNIFKLYVADYNIEEDQFIEIYKGEVSENNLNIASVYSDDLTGDHNKEIIITGVDIKGYQVFEIYKLISIKDSEESSLINIFSKAADGDFDINKIGRGNDYKIDNLPGESFLLELQKKNSDDNKTLIVEKYKWNENSYLYELSSSDKVKISAVSNESLIKFYRGTSDDYLQFLSGPWYKINDHNGNPTHNMNGIFHMINDEQTLTFFSDDIQESFTWADNRKPTKFRNALSFYDVRNNFLKSKYSQIIIYIDSFESIRVEIRGDERWGGTYTQLNKNLQKALTETSKENTILSDTNINGLYKTNLNTELIFDNPEYILKEDGYETNGIYTIFKLQDDLILEMKELNENGLTEQIKTYKMKYNESSDDLRIIRTITLQKGILKSQGINLESNSELHFEQIEKINPEVTDNL